MKTTPAALADFSGDRLAVAYGILNARAVAAPRSSLVCARAIAARDRVGEEVSRRGFVIRRLSDGQYACGRPADFAPIEAGR